jgi:hypothetical protein
MPILSNGGGSVLEEAGTESFRDLERFRNANGTRLTADLRIEMQRPCKQTWPFSGTKTAFAQVWGG